MIAIKSWRYSFGLLSEDSGQMSYFDRLSAVSYYTYTPTAQIMYTAPNLDHLSAACFQLRMKKPYPKARDAGNPSNGTFFKERSRASQLLYSTRVQDECPLRPKSPVRIKAGCCQYSKTEAWAHDGPEKSRLKPTRNWLSLETAG